MSDISEGTVRHQENQTFDSQTVISDENKFSSDERSELNETDFQSNQNVTEEIIEIPRMSFSSTNQKSDIKSTTKENEEESEENIQSQPSELLNRVTHRPELPEPEQIPDPIEGHDEDGADETEVVDVPNVTNEYNSDVHFELPVLPSDFKLHTNRSNQLDHESQCEPSHDQFVIQGTEDTNVTHDIKPDDNASELQFFPTVKKIHLKDESTNKGDEDIANGTQDSNESNEIKPEGNLELQVLPTKEDNPLQTKDVPVVVDLQAQTNPDEQDSVDGIRGQGHLAEVEGSHNLPEEDEVSFCPSGGGRPEQAIDQVLISTTFSDRSKKLDLFI
jgi:hypothetical protein